MKMKLSELKQFIKTEARKILSEAGNKLKKGKSYGQLTTKPRSKKDQKAK